MTEHDHGESTSGGLSTRNSQSMAMESEESESTDEIEESEDGGDTPALPPTTRTPSIVSSSASNSPSEDESFDHTADPIKPGFEPINLSEIDKIVNIDDEQSNCPQVPENGAFDDPPSIEDAQSALDAIKLVLKKPKQDTVLVIRTQA